MACPLAGRPPRVRAALAARSKPQRRPTSGHTTPSHWGNQGGIPHSAIREGNWKLIQFYYQKGVELYNLAQDPGERQNIAGKYPPKVKELTAKLEAKLKATDALLPIENPNPKKPFEKW